jgi:RNA polymerase sigma-70 factor (ECF subfamily)
LSTTQPPDDFDPAIAELVRSKAARLRGRARLNHQDIEDLSQECRLELFRKLGRFDSSRGEPDAFVARILRNYVSNLLRNRSALRRDPRRVSSLGAADRAGRVPEASCHRPGRKLRPGLEAAELRQDVLAILEALPLDLCDLALRLMHQTVAEVAREIGVPRTTLQSRLRKLRTLFERHDLRDYL